jgi:hypothetical protein
MVGRGRRGGRSIKKIKLYLDKFSSWCYNNNIKRGRTPKEK